MKYYEQGCLFEDLPDWVENAIRLGYTLVSDKKVSSKKIHLISSPFESSIAPLVALGALRASLERADDNLCNNYFSFLLSAREKVLTSRNSSLEAWHVRKHTDPEKQYYFSEEVDSTGIVVTGHKRSRGKKKNESLKSWIMSAYATDWQINGLPVPQSSLQPDPSLIGVMESLPVGLKLIKKENLTSSYLEHILVSASAGDNSNYMDLLRKSGFTFDGSYISMADLLMLGDDSKSTISRVTLIGERQLEEHAFYQDPSVIIAQGTKETVSAWNIFSDISGTSIVGVINRSGSRAALEEFEAILQDRQRYYHEIPSPVSFQSPYIQIRSMERI
ncbi:MAG: hypothetical protein VXZ24_13775 [Pseudomonadota bacterium]|nr:hypothetical protein [Pseudomonadota bacterium]